VAVYPPEPTPQSIGRTERARLQADALTEAHSALSDLDPLGELTDWLDHTARKIRILRETVRMTAQTSRR
jgi:hypothetical protein